MHPTHPTHPNILSAMLSAMLSGALGTPFQTFAWVAPIMSGWVPQEQRWVLGTQQAPLKPALEASRRAAFLHKGHG